MAINTTSSTSATTYLNKTYFDRNLLENAKTKMVHALYGQKRSIPKNGGKTVEFRRWTPLTVDLSQNDPNAASSSDRHPGGFKLTEGVTPASQSLAQTNVTATVDQYGAFYEVSDMLKTTAFDDVVEGATDMLGEALGTAIDWVTRDAMCQTTTIQYANGRANRAAVTASDKLTTTEIRKAVRTLKKKKARMFTREGGKQHFIAIVSPDAVFDLQSDQLWQDVSKYSNAEQVYSGEIGRIFGVVFIESTEAKVYAGQGASSVDVHCTLVFGKDAYGTIDIEGSGNIHTIVKKAGSAGTSDPLDQRSTVGGKVDAYTAKILNNNWILAIEHGVTA